jgi:hypothetical protein
VRLITFLLSLGQLLLAALLSVRPLAERRGFRWALVVVLLVSGLGWLWLGTRDLLGAEASSAAPSAEALVQQLVEQGALLGRVQDGELALLAPAGSAGGRTRLTEIGMAESVAPESGEIDLQPYEGCALVVRGHDGGGWIYEAEILEESGPLLTSMVEQFFP